MYFKVGFHVSEEVMLFRDFRMELEMISYLCKIETQSVIVDLL